MKLAAFLLGLLVHAAAAGDSYFFAFEGETEPSKTWIEDDHLGMMMKIRKIDLPEAKYISAYHTGLGEGRNYKIQVHLKSLPEQGWMPMLKLGDDVIILGISVERPHQENFAASFSIENDNPEKITAWTAALAKLLKVPDEAVNVNLDDESPAKTSPSPSTSSD